ncbi:MAG TPA: hypothetical protein VN048_13985 [Verrucomicrobiae bacterium]|nr:hypothetical protein [Verrucomicrobiae bacterium]
MQKVAVPRGTRSRPPASSRRALLWVHRLARACLWHDPSLYRWFGRLRGRGDCLNLDYDLWIDGFPGSGTALAATAFWEANPEVKLAGRWHAPPFILHALYSFKPGIFLIRQPADAAISSAILSNSSLGESLDYYNDFHRVMAPQASWMFVAPFEDIMTQCATVIESFNLHYRTNYAAPAQNPAARLATAKPSAPQPEGAVRELRVARPSPISSSLKNEMRQHLHESPALRRKLEQARKYYSAFLQGERRTKLPNFNVSTRHLPSMA